LVICDWGFGMSLVNRNLVEMTTKENKSPLEPVRPSAEDLGVKKV
jgi:hypothetical protein